MCRSASPFLAALPSFHCALSASGSASGGGVGWGEWVGEGAVRSREGTVVSGRGSGNAATCHLSALPCWQQAAEPGGGAAGRGLRAAVPAGRGASPAILMALLRCVASLRPREASAGARLSARPRDIDLPGVGERGGRGAGVRWRVGLWASRWRRAPGWPCGHAIQLAHHTERVASGSAHAAACMCLPARPVATAGAHSAHRDLLLWMRFLGCSSASAMSASAAVLRPRLRTRLRPRRDWLRAARSAAASARRWGAQNRAWRRQLGEGGPEAANAGSSGRPGHAQSSKGPQGRNCDPLSQKKPSPPRAQTDTRTHTHTPTCVQPQRPKLCPHALLGA